MDIAQIKKSRAILKEVANRIEEHPEKYNQTSWCGTACCIAGHIVFSQGAKRIKGSDDSVKVKTSEFSIPVKDLAYQMLGFPNSASIPWDIIYLFKPDPAIYWANDRWQAKWRNAKTGQERANVAANYIRKYIIPNVFPLKRKIQ